MNVDPLNQNSPPVQRRSDDDKKKSDAPPKRDFRRVLDKTEDEKDARKAGEQDAEGVEEYDSDKKKGTNLSMYEVNTPKKPASAALAGQVMMSNAPQQKLPVQKTPYNIPVKGKDDKPESPSALFSKLSKAAPKKEGKASSILSDENVNAAERDVSSKSSDDGATDADSGGGSSLYQAMQDDISYVNPLAASAINTESVLAKGDTPTIPRTDMQQLVSMIDKVYVVESKGQTDTSIVLKEPPMFAGSTLVLTSFDRAHGEFNISFHNLSQAAQQVISMRANQNDLLDSLHKIGYTVHIVVATTEPPPVQAPQASQDRQRQNDKQQRDGQPRKDQRQG